MYTPCRHRGPHRRTTLTKAERFRLQVEEAGEQWPEGSVKGRGYRAEEPPPVEQSRPTVLAMLTRYIEQ